MNREIEDMAKTLCGQKEHSCAECDSCDLCEFWLEASILYANGYRKATDVAREILALVWDAYQTTHYDAEFEERLDNIEKKYESEGADDEQIY